MNVTITLQETAITAVVAVAVLEAAVVAATKVVAQVHALHQEVAVVHVEDNNYLKLDIYENKKRYTLCFLIDIIIGNGCSVTI